MQRSLLTRLRINGYFYIASGLLWLLIIPFVQIFLLNPGGYNKALNAINTSYGMYSAWVYQHIMLFLLHRILLLLAFACLLTFPFSLYRIIVAQELIEQIEIQEKQNIVREVIGEETGNNNGGEGDDSGDDRNEEERNVLHDSPWRGKGFAVFAAWAGLIGVILSLIGTGGGTIYTLVESLGPTQAIFPFFVSFFSIMANTVGIGCIALATLFFGAMIARGGIVLWPRSWLLFGYAALALTALLSGSAVAVASAPLNQSVLTTPALLLFALWILWFGVMLIVLKPEA